MRGDKQKYNKSIIYPAIINLAYYKGCTIRDVVEFCPKNTTNKCNIARTIEILEAKKILEKTGQDETQNYATIYKLTAIGKMLLSKCNSEIVILFDLMTPSV
jgi:hypothetical protein